MDELIFKLILLVSIQGYGIRSDGTCLTDTITLPKHESTKFKGFTDEMEKTYEDCEDSDCLFISDYTDTKLYKVCKCNNPTCTEDGGVDATTTIATPVPTASSTNTEDGGRENGGREDGGGEDGGVDATTTIATPVPTSCSKVKETRSWDGLAIGLLVLGMVLGSVTMTIVCVCAPQLHRNATRCLNRRGLNRRGAIRNRQSEAAVMPSITELTQQHPERQVVQFNYHTSFSNDQLPQVEPSENQSIGQINEDEAHDYLDLNGPHNIYDEPYDISASVNLIELDNNEDNAEGVNVQSNSNIPRKEDTTTACDEYVIFDPQIHSSDGTVTRNRRSYVQDFEVDGYLLPKSKRDNVQDHEVDGNLQPKIKRANAQDYEVAGNLQPKSKRANVQDHEVAGNLQPISKRANVQDHEVAGNLQPKSKRANVQDHDVAGNLQPKSKRAYEQDYEEDDYLQMK